MHAIARIRFDGGMLMLPSRTPYEIELLLENLDWYTARHEAVQLEIDNHRWRVAHGSSDMVEECARCHRARATLTFVNGSRVSLCVACARVAVGSRFAEWPRPEPARRAAYSRVPAPPGRRRTSPSTLQLRDGGACRVHS